MSGPPAPWAWPWAWPPLVETPVSLGFLSFSFNGVPFSTDALHNIFKMFVLGLFSFFLSTFSCRANSLPVSCYCSVAKLYPTLCDPMDRSMPGPPVHHQLPEFTQTHVHRVSDAIQPSHPLSSPSPPALNLSQHWGLFQWVGSLQQVAKVLEF